MHLTSSLRWWPAGVLIVSVAAICSTIGDPHPLAEVMFMWIGALSGLVGLTATTRNVRPSDWRVFQLVPCFAAEAGARVMYVWSLNRTIQSKVYTTAFLVVIVLWSVALAASTLTRYAIHDLRADSNPEKGP